MRGVTSETLRLFLYSTISTHTPHARRDCTLRSQNMAIIQFQLTRLMRGVTGVGTVDVANASNFNSHASCEA